MSKPPKYIIQFFRWFCRSDYVEDIEGDLLERFEERCKSHGITKAKIAFLIEIIKLLRPSLLKKVNGPFARQSMMFRNDLKASWRVLLKEKLYTSINLIGLTSGLVMGLLIISYVQFEISYEQYNPNARKVVRITTDYMDGETVVDQDCETYHVLGPMMKESFPSIHSYTRAYDMFEAQVRVEDKIYRVSSLYAVDPSFLEIFHHPLISGNSKTVLNDPNQVILTESVAKQYFGTIDVVGKRIEMSVCGPAIITGVIKDPPANTHLKFDLLLSYNSIKDRISKRESQWIVNDTKSYLMLDREESYSQFLSSLTAFNDKLLSEELLKNERIIAQKIEDIHLYSHKSFETEPNGEAKVVYFLLVVGLLVMLIAIVNYVNLTTARALDRAKEVGIRKVIGSSKGQLTMRFFIDSLIVNVLSGALALFIIFMNVESFKAIANLPPSFQFIDSSTFWITFVAALIVSILLSGIFPTATISSIKPIAALKNKFSSSKGGIRLRKTLVIFQFSIAIFLLILTLTATKQLSFLQHKDLGMDTEHVVVVHAPSGKQMQSFDSFRKTLSSKTPFESIAFSTAVPGLPTSEIGSSTNIHLTDDQEKAGNNFYMYSIDSGFLKTMNIELVAGQNFSASIDHLDPIMVNEESLSTWGISDAGSVIGKRSKIGKKEFTVIGVIKNFHQVDLKSKHLPLILFPAPPGSGYMSILLKPGDLAHQIEVLEASYREHFPNNSFDYFFVDQAFGKQFEDYQKMTTIFTLLSVFSILITCLGLFGLTTFSVARRAKEVGIRKVLGASILQLITLLTKDSVLLVGLASFVGIPISVILTQKWLEQYAFRIEVAPSLFVWPTLLALTIAITSVLVRTIKVSAANPVDSLRDE